MQEIHAEYEKFLDHDTKRFVEARKRLRQLTVLRFVSFAGIVVSIAWLPPVSQIVAWTAATLCLVLFLYFLKLFTKKEKEKKLYDRLTRINSDELLALKEVYNQFDGGAEFTDPQHDFSFDMDLFGEGSMFRFLNRTATPNGKIKLAGFLKNPLTEANDIEQRQKAVEELSTYTRWRQYFAATIQADNREEMDFTGELHKRTGIRNHRTLISTLIIFPSISVAFLLLAIFSVLPLSFFMASYCVNIFILIFYRKSIDDFYKLFGKQSAILKNFPELFRLAEQKEFETELLDNLRKDLFHERQPASSIVRQLQRAMTRFDYRLNIIFALSVNFIFLWELICVYQLDKWHTKYKDHIQKWFDSIYELDALCSLANLNHNNPEWALPIIEKNEFCLSANDLGHPLIRSNKRAGNDLRMTGKGKIMIVTGANMAGKSTFLRTVGVNMILGMNGCRVCATWFTMKPVKLFTNIRTTDNLQKEESYFFAELLRLQKMLSLIRQGEPLFIMIDEMLKGTNSQDKLIGSKALVEQLIHLQTNGLVATHDLKLTDLAKVFPGAVINKCFDIHLSNDELTFDYKLRDGVTQTMNASFLMKKMGIIN